MNLTTGPVEMRPAVREALARPAIPHRGAAFAEMLTAVKARLRALTGAREVAALHGSGTLANDAIAAHLQGRGIVLTNGEFGERLVGHAQRAGLDFVIYRSEWGAPLRLEPQPVDWVWACHCETSTGTLNHLGSLKAFAARCGAKLVLDCVSSIGAVPVDLGGVHLASGVSGKALGSASGAAIVFAAEPVDAEAPPSIDLARYWAGNPFTFPSPVLAALGAALDRDWPARFREVASAGARLRAVLKPIGNAPHVLTFRGSLDLARRLESGGVLVGAHSGYLIARGWLQACLMGEVDIDSAAAVLAEELACSAS